MRTMDQIRLLSFVLSCCPFEVEDEEAFEDLVVGEVVGRGWSTIRETRETCPLLQATP